MTPQPVAEPVGEPQAALIATCANCGGEIARFNTAAVTGKNTMPGRWRHDNGAITCPPIDPTFDHLVKGDSA